MNRQITRLAVFSVLLLVSLIVATTYWQTWASAGLADRQDNAIRRVAQFTIRRGQIYAADGRTVLATNIVKKVDGKTLYFRRYPAHGLAAHVVGYSTQSRSRAGLERAQNDYLIASNKTLRTILDTTLDRLRGATIKGNTLELTLDASAQKLANELLIGKCGAVVALEPGTGRLLVMASSPTYDPNLVERRFDEITRIRGACTPAAPLVNRATDGLYIPGSTFKVVTAAAALDSGRFTPNSTFFDPGYCIEYGKRVLNYSDQSGPSVYGRVNFAQALQYSINSVFCQLGNRLGPLRVLEYAKRFGFYSVPPFDTPTNERVPSGLYKRGKLFYPSKNFQVDAGRLAFGQERMLVTPLQMAMVVAAIANGGRVMRPYVVGRVVSPDRKTVSRRKPEDLGQAVRPETAATLASMMETAVRAGTGTAAQISGVRVAGKTGTAETGVAGRNTTSFITFAPVEAPRVAIAVILENQDGTGGRTAAPIARELMQALLSRAS
jgi:penicillin-binding protein A